MLKFNYSQQETTFKKKLKKLLAEFEKHRSFALKMPFSNLPWQNIDLLKQIKLPKRIKNIAIVGIGGSSLGSKALLKGLLKTNVVFFDNVDPDFINGQMARISPRKTLFFLISKSGETIEILALADFLISRIKAFENFIVITDNPESSLGKIAKKNKIPVFQSPKNVPGRFSVLSVVGLLPASLNKLDSQKILDGAKHVVWRTAYELACRQYLHFLSGKNITVLFPYSEALSYFADWHIQLIAESIGKSKKIGVTPIKAIGAKDQHSQLQLFLDGPDDKFYIFIKPLSPKHSAHKHFSKLFDAEYEGVKQAFIKKKKPFLEITIPEISEKTLGGLFYFFELETVFLGSLFKINPENQPAVELSKHLTKLLLKTH